MGSVRVGVAASDPDGLVATPVETVGRTATPAAAPAVGDADVARVVEILRERGAAVVYIGLPRHLSGREGSASGAARTYAAVVAQAAAPVPVRLVDERLSTVTAHQSLHASGRSGRRHRAVVDQQAAVVILQSALDAERTTGARVGEPVEAGAHTRGRPTEPGLGRSPTGGD